MADEPVNTAPVITVEGDGVVYARPVVGIPNTGDDAMVLTADMDGDGDLDVVVLNRSVDRIDWFANDGSGNISGTPVSLATSVLAMSMTIADIDDDGINDLVVTQNGDAAYDPLDGGKAVWYKAHGDGTFGASQEIYSGGLNSFESVAVDFDGDGDLDLLTASTNLHNSIGLSLNDGAGNFTVSQLDAGGFAPQSIVAKDVNGDGLIDLIVGGSSEMGTGGWATGSAVNVSLNNGDGTFSLQTLEIGSNPSVWDVEVADIDGDGHLDILATAPNVGGLVWFKNDGTGTYDAGTNISTQYEGRVDSALGDIDGDGDIDIATMESEGGTGRNNISWFENDGTGNFTEHRTDLYTDGEGTIDLADLNGDGLLDIVRGGRAGETNDIRNIADVTLAYKSIAVDENVASKLTGISFSDTTTGASVTVNLSVASGSLTGVTGNGITVSGSATGTLILTGSLANINAFIAAENVAFTTATDSETDVKLTISIDDGAVGGSKTATSTILLDVIPAPDLPPTDFVLTGNTVAEESSVGTVVGTFSANDPEGKALTYTLADDAGGRFSLVTEGTGASAVVKLVVAGPLDFETGPNHQVTVTVSDGKNEVSENFNVVVTDVVENLPPTGLALSNDEVSEAAAIGTVVGAFSATDPEGETLTYTLTDDADGIFEIVGNQLRVKSALDYESATSHVVTVSVSDGVEETTQTFSIGVTDVDDVVEPRDTITIDASGSTGMDFEAYVRGGFTSDVEGGGFPVFDNSGEFSGEEMLLGYGSEATSKYVSAHGSLEYYFGTHTVAGDINTLEFGTRGSGTYDSNGYFTGGNVELKITGLDFSNPTPANSTEEQAIEATGEVHNFAVAYMYGAAADQTRLDRFGDQLDQYAQNFIGSTGTDIYIGTRFDDTVNGNNGNDTLAGGGGDDVIDGGQGTDTLVYTGLEADYSYVENGDGTWTVTDNRSGSINDGVDTVSNTEYLQFSDETVEMEPAPENTAPTGLTLSNNKIAENVAVGTGVGMLSATDAEGDALTWSLSGGGGKFDLVTRSGVTRLFVDGVLDHEKKSSYSINLTASDGELETSQSFTIKVTDVVDLVKGNDNANVLSGASGADLIRGLGGNDKLYGYGGADILVGGKGMDKLYGGAGADAFVFATGDTAKGKASADIIYDFGGGQGDVIDLTGYDANAKKSGNQDFDFIGKHDFNGKAGELRFEKTGSDTFVYGDTNGDGQADFTIHLDSAVNLKADHFDF